MRRRSVAILWSAGAAAIATAQAQADIIKPLVDPSTGAHSGWEVVIFDDDHADIITDAVNLQAGTVVIEKFAEFIDIDPFTGAPEAINLTFRQVLPDAQTVDRFVITDEVIINSTGLTWVDFENFLVDHGSATFNIPLSADFSIDPFTQREYFSNDTAVRFFGGQVGPGEIWTPGRLAGGLAWDVDLSEDNPVIFTLKELPSVPGPASVALLGLAGVMAGRRRR